MTEGGPLAGIRVADLTTTVMGPYCTLLLAQLGADVIKVEAPGGDLIRWADDRHGEGMSPLFLNANRGKRSIVLDLKDPAGFEALTRLARRADVLVHNMRPRAAARLGLSYAAIRAANPRCVYCELHGFGAGGPYSDQPAYDDVIQAVSGLAAVQGGDGPPAYVRSLVADKVAGLMALSAILAALHDRQRTGTGQAVEVPMFESVASFLLIDQQGGWVFDPPQGPPGYARTASPHRRPYRTRDGYLAVMAYTDAQWQSFFAIIGQPRLSEDPRYRTLSDRTRHVDELYALVGEELARRATADWLAALEAASLPAVPVRTVPELFDDPQVTAVGLLEPVRHPTEGPLRQARLPVRFSASPPSAAAAAPGLGEHSRQILAELGYSPEEVAALTE